MEGSTNGLVFAMPCSTYYLGGLQLSCKIGETFVYSLQKITKVFSLKCFVINGSYRSEYRQIAAACKTP